jgi:hypothetical protein
MLEEKLKEAIVAELKRQAANDPQSLSIESSDASPSRARSIWTGAVAGGP